MNFALTGASARRGALLALLAGVLAVSGCGIRGDLERPQRIVSAQERADRVQALADWQAGAAGASLGAPAQARQATPVQ